MACLRRITKYIVEDLLDRKMVMISGPRQCGKTTLANFLPLSQHSRAYYNWDVDKDRKLIVSSSLDETKDLWLLDEIHKYRRWRNWLKGIYDLHRDNHQIVVTGSARLDLYARGGDSLQGRYFNYRLHPLTLSELLGQPELDYRQSMIELDLDYRPVETNEVLRKLLSLGGFPEPYFKNSPRFVGRWRLAYGRRLVREDVRSLEQTQELDLMELLYERLPELVGNNLSINNIAQDLEVAHQTAGKWIAIFEKLYACFYVLPWGLPKIRAVKKERKLYLWDWSRIESPGPQLENLVAVHLLRLVHWFEDVYGEKLDLRYFRDTDGHEVDFILLRKNKPWIAIEVKSSAQSLSGGLNYLLKRVAVPYAYQVHFKGDLDTRVSAPGKTIVRMFPLGKLLALMP